MSSPDQITSALRSHFDGDGRPAVFWNDAAAAFEALELNRVRKWDIKELDLIRVVINRPKSAIK